jgi:Pyruvate/2-oxoacid:ferredoxin oxidoreductase delta subunit
MELAAPIRIGEAIGDTSSGPPGYELVLQKMKVRGKDISGRARVVPDGDTTETIAVQNVFVAIGAVAEDLWQFPDSEKTTALPLSHCRLFDHKIPMVYGGDLATPVKSVSDAIASGKQAAMALDTYFQHGAPAIEARLAGCRVGAGAVLSMDVYLGKDRKHRSSHTVSYDEIVSDYFPPATRSVPTTLDADERLRSFVEIESTLEDSDARNEAERCFNCGICTACDYCRLYCPEMAVVVKNARRSINLDFCKGCGVCATECPRNAMALEEELK